MSKNQARAIDLPESETTFTLKYSTSLPPLTDQGFHDLLNDIAIRGIELFARQEAPGFTSIGNDIDGKDIRDALAELTVVMNDESVVRNVA